MLCQNNIQSTDVCCNVLAHELLHAFDFCRAKVDFENLRHLACTEVSPCNEAQIIHGNNDYVSEMIVRFDMYRGRVSSDFILFYLVIVVNFFASWKPLLSLPPFKRMSLNLLPFSFPSNLLPGL